MMNKAPIFKLAPPEEYSDEVLYGSRIEAHIRENKSYECVIKPIGTAYVRKRDTWTLRNLVGNDSRVRTMMDQLNLKFGLPLQRYTWPQIDREDFPILAISPQSTGKTFCHLLYCVSKGISEVPFAITNSILSLDEELTPFASTDHPRYIIITSNHNKVEQLSILVKNFKLAAFGTQREVKKQLDYLPPKTRTLDVHMSDTNLALRCCESYLLLTTPGALIKCLKLDCIRLDRCEKIFFDDLDVALQLQSHNIKTLIKNYFASIYDDDCDDSSDELTGNCMIYMFARKWTDLVKTFVKSAFKQMVLIFGSVSEAAIYANLGYDLEIYDNPRTSLCKLINIAKYLRADPKYQDIAIVCNSSREAERVSIVLSDQGISTLYLPDRTPLLTLRKYFDTLVSDTAKIFYSMSDQALDLVVEELRDISCIIHYSMPQDILTFDTRFRLMYNHIEELNKNLRSVLFLSSRFDPKSAKELYDLVCRSATTSHSTKLEIRDMIKTADSSICWRWASMGFCRLDKFSRADKFGIFCPDKHALAKCDKTDAKAQNRWPKGGQLKIIVTHLVSPNEFYFWFEAHRDIDSVNKIWSRLESTGFQFMQGIQAKLDQLKDTSPYTIPLRCLKKGKVYGVYFAQEKRVDRVKLLEEPKIDEDLIVLSESGYQFTEQCQVVKIDYGYNIHVFMKNIFELPQDLASIEPQCHRGFHIGVKPLDNEPEWHFQAKQKFYDLFCMTGQQEVRVWLRLNSDDCFWFENMEVLEVLKDFNDKYLIKPHDKLVHENLADICKTELSCLEPSERLMTESKWHIDKLTTLVQHAFLRRDKEFLDVFLLHVMNNLSLRLRQVDFNQQLIDLEARISEDFKSGKLSHLEYFKPGTICLAKIWDSCGLETYSINRCQLKCELSRDDAMDQADDIEPYFEVICLDHGDVTEVSQSSLYLPLPEHISLLPFQSIACHWSNFNTDLLKESTKYRFRIQNIIYDLSRDHDNQLVTLKCQVKSDGHVRLFVPVETDGYIPLDKLVSTDYKIDLVKEDTNTTNKDSSHS